MIVPASDQGIARAAEALQRGELVAFPTETVYGLGADATNAMAVAAIFELKGRPRFNPLIVHVGDTGMAERYGILTDTAKRLAHAFWPGALTLVVAKRKDAGIADLTTAGLDTIALRAPDHAVARSLLDRTGLPIAAPSANRSGHVSPTLAQHVEDDLGDGPAMILDGGATVQGIESTVIDTTAERPILLRPGAVPREAIEDVLGMALVAGTGQGKIASPGQLECHYAPRAKLRLNADSVEAAEALLAFGPDVPSGASPVFNLSPSGDLREAAANLFRALRELDGSGADTIAAMPIPNEGLGEAINDRLRKAAAPKKS